MAVLCTIRGTAHAAVLITAVVNAQTIARGAGWKSRNPRKFVKIKLSNCWIYRKDERSEVLKALKNTEEY